MSIWVRVISRVFVGGILRISSYLIHTKELVSLKQKELKSSILIYGTRIRTQQIWNNFSASPDLELLLAKTKKELWQAPLITLSARSHNFGYGGGRVKLQSFSHFIS
jgi:hypothetical protein